MKKLIIVYVTMFLMLVGINLHSQIYVDIYVNMQTGSHGDSLTQDTAEATAYGAFHTDSNVYIDFTDVNHEFLISDSYVVDLPGAVIVRDSNMVTTGVHTWSFPNKWENNRIQFFWDTVGHVSNYDPHYDKVTAACYFYTNQTAAVPNQHDNLELHGYPGGYSVFQNIGTAGDGADTIYFRGHGDTATGPPWSGTTFTDSILCEYNHLYWINLHHDAAGGQAKVAIFDAEDNYSLVGIDSCTTRVALSMSELEIGRCSGHSDAPDNATRTWVQHLIIDFTNGTFPLLPDTSSVGLHYVSPSGTGTWEQSRAIETPCALHTANDSVEAGDSVYLMAGTYTDSINTASSGSSGNIILFRNNPGDSVVIYNVAAAMFFDLDSFITVDSIFACSTEFGFWLDSSNNITIQNCVFNIDRDTSNWQGPVIFRASNYNHIDNCTFTRWGYSSKNNCLNIGDVDDVDSTRYNLIENSTFYYTGHHAISVNGLYNVIRGNNFHNQGGSAPDDIYGYRCVITEGIYAGWCLYENNRIHHADTASGFSLRSPHNIVRYNRIYKNADAGIQLATDNEAGYVKADSNIIYNNTIFANGYDGDTPSNTGGVLIANWGRGSPVGNIFQNNIFFHDSGGYKTESGAVVAQTWITSWIDTDDPLFVDTTSDDPFNDTLPDFMLTEGSACIDSGTALTQADGAGAGIDKLAVDNSRFFQDGSWAKSGLLNADIIAITTVTDTVTISSIDYDNDTIHLANTMTWSDNDSVWIYSISDGDSVLLGDKPDLGAFELSAEDTSLVDSVVPVAGLAGDTIILYK